MEAVELIARAALTPGDRVLVEEPGHHILRQALTASGLRCTPIPIDDQGFDILQAIGTAGPAKAVSVTPSRQFPLGITLPLPRRLQLLKWATETNGYIIEDDFDGEYRYRGHPLPAMMSLDEQERVIYVGSFSKVMFSALRLSFMVLPKALIAPTTLALNQTGPRASLIPQPALTRFIEEGAFATHIRRMRRLYAQRQVALTTAIACHAQGLLEVEPSPAGMHLVVAFAPAIAGELSDAEVSAKAAKAGVTARALSTFYAGKPDRQGLVLGYAAFTEAEIDAGVRGLAAILRQA
ncbi:MAG: aminotransferase-like domain-containing protein [Alphaproteobacteria bacterium]